MHVEGISPSLLGRSAGPMGTWTSVFSGLLWVLEQRQALNPSPEEALSPKL